MGRAKQAWIEAQERGWDELDKHVCANCVGHPYLGSLVNAAVCHNFCDYCLATKPSAEVSSIMDAVCEGIQYQYNDAPNAGVPYDKEMPYESYSSYDVLDATLGYEGVAWPDELFEDVTHALHDRCWVEAPEGDFLGSYAHQRYRWSWAAFVEAVKHHSRFHFHRHADTDDYGERPISPGQMLSFLGRVFKAHNMVRTISVDTVLVRVRRGVHPLTAEAAGPPPHAKATAGRMNPAGIPYLYLAFEERTALVEARAVVGEDVTLSRWRPTRDLRVLDLTHQPQCMSIFEGRDPSQDHVIFLRHFVQDICKPVGKNDIPEIEYVPTQLVCEYLAQVFAIPDGPLDGLIFPSSLTTGKNLVLFPERGKRYAESSLQRFGMTVFQSAQVIKV
jgi:hypothetical protein